MKSKLISFTLCLAVIGAVFALLFGELPKPKSPQKEEEETAPVITETAETAVSRTYVIKAAHDAEDFFEKLAYGKEVALETALPDLVDRLSASAEYLKTDLQDYYGATYFTKVSEILQEINSTPFTDSVTFSARATKILTELENAYPADAAAAIDEKHPETPMHYPKFDTSANGKTALGLLSLYRQQYQKQNNAILLTLGGSLILGDTLLGANGDNSFASLQQNSSYSYPLFHLASVLKTDSASFASLEAPLTDAIGDTTVAGSVKGLQDYAKLIKEGGIDTVSIANKGIALFGEEGVTDTKNALKSADVSYSEEGQIIYYQTALGTIAYLSYDITDEVSQDKNLCFEEPPKTDIAAAKSAGAKIVIVHFNWVNTDQKNPYDPCMSQVNTAHKAVDNGASLVFGTFPNAMESLEKYNNVSIIYSSGKLFTKEQSQAPAYLYQQAFLLNEEGNAVPGEIQVFPISLGASADLAPSLILDAAGVENFQNEILKVSKPMRNGVGKTNNFTIEDLHLISIKK